MDFRKIFLKDFNIKESAEHIIIDCKGGIHDIQAILVALHSAKQYKKNVVGITCVAGGPENIEGAMLDALVACKLFGTKIPIHRGNL